MSILALDQRDAREMEDSLYSTPPDPNAFGPGFFTGSLSAIPKGLGSAALKVEETVQPMVADIVYPIAKYSDETFGTSLKGYLDEQEKQFQEEIMAGKKATSPDPATTGWLGQQLNSLTSVISRFVAGTALTASPIGGAALAGGTEAQSAYNESVDKGTDPTTASGIAAIEGTATAVGSLIPFSFGKTVLGRVATGQASNVLFGGLNRGSIHEWMKSRGYEAQAEQYQWLDRNAILSDFVLGTVFGGLGARELIKSKSREVVPSDVDAALALNEQHHLDVDTSLGIPADTMARNAHTKAMETAIDQMTKGEEVNVDSIIKGAEFIERPPAEHVNAIINQALKDAGYHDVVEELSRMPTEEAAASGAKPSKEADISVIKTMVGEKGDMYKRYQKVQEAVLPDPTAAKDISATMRWFKLKDREAFDALPESERSKYHQLFTDAFEKYQKDGNAPAYMKPVFDRFGKIMQQVYEGETRSAASPVDEALHQNPDMKVVTEKGVEPAESAMTKADDTIHQAQNDARGFKAAVVCFLRFGT